MRVGEAMTRRVETVSANENARAALQRMRTMRIRHLVVMQGEKLAGVVSDRDVGFTNDRTVGDVMTVHVVAAAPETTLRQAANLLRGRSIGCLPVIDDGKLVGILTITDLLELLGRGSERPVSKGKRWILKGRGPRRKAVVGRKNFAAH
jgi:acetoin utilization protein AcuB